MREGEYSYNWLSIRILLRCIVVSMYLCISLNFHRPHLLHSHHNHPLHCQSNPHLQLVWINPWGYHNHLHLGLHLHRHLELLAQVHHPLRGHG
jgi:hypothetical protein